MRQFANENNFMVQKHDSTFSGLYFLFFY